MQYGKTLWTALVCALRDGHCDWAHHRLRQRSAPIATPRTGRSVVFAPHYDDETFGCGGLIALKRQLGAQVDVVFLSDGRRSHAHDPTVDPAQLEACRQEEALAATAALGVAAKRVHNLHLPDGRLSTLTPAEREAALAQISALLQHVQPREVYVPHRRDHHPDHEGTFELVIAACEALGCKADVIQYAVWLIWRGPPRWGAAWAELGPAECLGIADVLTVKRQAIAAYRTQLPVLPRGFLRQFTRPYELYFPLQPQAKPIPTAAATART